MNPPPRARPRAAGIETLTKGAAVITELAFVRHMNGTRTLYAYHVPTDVEQVNGQNVIAPLGRMHPAGWIKVRELDFGDDEAGCIQSEANQKR